MTQAEALAALTELRALERLLRAITELQTSASEWRAALVALDDRIRLVRYCLGQQDAALIASVEEIADYEAMTHTDGPVVSPDTASMPVSRTIH